MSFSELASLGSFVSGLTVVVSFRLLGAADFGQGNRNQQALMQQGRAGRTVELLLRVAEPALHESMMRGASGDLAMEPAKADMFVRIMIAAFVNWEDAFLQSRMRAIDPAGRAADDSAMRALLSAPSYRAAWKTPALPVRRRLCATMSTRMLRQAEPTPAFDLGATWKAPPRRRTTTPFAGHLSISKSRPLSALPERRGELNPALTPLSRSQR